MKQEWTEEEKAFLRKYYETHGAAYCCEHLHRSKATVWQQARYLRLKAKITVMGANPVWTQADEAFLRENYEVYGLIHCVKVLGRTQSAVLHKAERMGLKRKGRGRKDREVQVKGYHAVSKYNNRVCTHRAVVEEQLGRKLRTDELVHHKNGDITDNRPENLEIVSRSEHMKIHSETRIRDEKGRFIS